MRSHVVAVKDAEKFPKSVLNNYIEEDCLEEREIELKQMIDGDNERTGDAIEDDFAADDGSFL